MADRKTANRITAELRDAERAAEKARQARAVAEEKARKDAERVAQAEADAALNKDQKAARDSKYAARKARQRQATTGCGQLRTVILAGESSQAGSWSLPSGSSSSWLFCGG